MSFGRHPYVHIYTSEQLRVECLATELPLMHCLPTCPHEGAHRASSMAITEGECQYTEGEYSTMLGVFSHWPAGQEVVEL